MAHDRILEEMVSEMVSEEMVSEEVVSEEMVLACATSVSCISRTTVYIGVFFYSTSCVVDL